MERMIKFGLSQAAVQWLRCTPRKKNLVCKASAERSRYICVNMKPNYKEMSRKELRSYVLAHRDDDEAFYAYIDKIEAEGNRVKHPPLKSIDDLQNYPEFLEKIRNPPGRQA